MAHKDPLSGMARTEMPYKNAISYYSSAVAKIVDQIHLSKSSRLREVPLEAFKWYVYYERAEGPEGVTDWREYADHLNKHSKVWLACLHGNWRGRAPLDEVPDKVKAVFEQHARLMCSSRLEEQDAPESETAANSVSSADLMLTLRRWLETNKHNYVVGEIARNVLYNLVKSSEE